MRVRKSYYIYFAGKKMRHFLISLGLCGLSCGNAVAQEDGRAVQVTGAMRNTMWNGQLGGLIDLDTLKAREGLCGIGPLEYLRGELLILDGRAYKSVVVNDSVMAVEETFSAKAPFFVHTRVGTWFEHPLPEDIQRLSQLESYLDQYTREAQRPFAFKLEGSVHSARIHVMDVPPGTAVRSPNDAHRHQKDFALSDVSCQILGFFSTEHQAVFTHHDTYLHLHLITADKSRMGHVDEVVFEKGGMRLFLPDK